MAGKKATPVKDAIIEVLRARGAMGREELAEEVARKVGTQPRVVKAVITKMIKRGELKEEGGKIRLA